MENFFKTFGQLLIIFLVIYITFFLIGSFLVNTFIWQVGAKIILFIIASVLTFAVALNEEIID